MRNPRAALVSMATYALALLFATPLIWVVLASLSTNADLLTSPIAVGLRFVNYASAWSDAQIGRFVFNSLVIACSTALLTTSVATLAGYALARTPIPGRALFLALVTIGIVAPVFTYITILTDTVVNAGLLNNRLTVVVVSTATFVAVPTLLMLAFFRDVPEELLDAARVDGATEWQVFWRIATPLARPALIASLVFCFVWSWNDLFLPVVFLQDTREFTIPQGIVALRNDAFTPDYVRMFAASVISTVPMVLLYRQLSRRTGSTIAAGALKG
jgi:ABC-type glycerol-3-phosphate transport system permease component